MTSAGVRTHRLRTTALHSLASSQAPVTPRFKAACSAPFLFNPPAVLTPGHTMLTFTVRMAAVELQVLKEWALKAYFTNNPFYCRNIKPRVKLQTCIYTTIKRYKPLNKNTVFREISDKFYKTSTIPQ